MSLASCSYLVLLSDSLFLLALSTATPTMGNDVDDKNGEKSLPASELALLASLAVVVPPVADQISGRRQAGVATICAALLACGGAAMLQSGGELLQDGGEEF